ncbi:MAG: hypothetical protein ACK56I_00735, partial [bacterium]
LHLECRGRGENEARHDPDTREDSGDDMHADADDDHRDDDAPSAQPGLGLGIERSLAHCCYISSSSERSEKVTPVMSALAQALSTSTIRW